MQVSEALSEAGLEPLVPFAKDALVIMMRPPRDRYSKWSLIGLTSFHLKWPGESLH